MQQAHFTQLLYSKFFSKSHDQKNSLSKEFTYLSYDEKKELSKQYLNEGEILLLKKDFSALEKFELASQLDPSNPNVWYRLGMAFFEYGSSENKEKALFIASKNFKIATNLSPTDFQIWWGWANLSFYIGDLKNDYHHLQQAKEKFQKAISFSEKQSKETLSELYWDYGKTWIKIAEFSGEAIDIRMAIQAYRLAFIRQTKISADFLIDFGKAHIQMALLINDNRLYFQAIDYFNKALSFSNNNQEALLYIAHAYTELYINTANESYFTKANDHYAKASYVFNHKSDELLLQWGQLLGESGKLNKNIKKLGQSIKKCLEAYKINPRNPLIIGQWVESLSYFGALLGRIDLIGEAERKIKKALTIYPKCSELWYASGICDSAYALYYKDTEFEDSSINKFKKGIFFDKSNAEIWHALASILSRQGIQEKDEELLREACDYFNKAIDLKPAYPVLVFDYGSALLALGEITNEKNIVEKASSYLENTLRMQHDAVIQHPEWIFNYAKSLDLLGSFEYDTEEEEQSYFLRAIEAFNNVLLIDPDFEKTYFHLSLTFTHLAEVTEDHKYYKKALNYFKLAYKQDEEDENLHLEWGLCLISLAQSQFDYDIIRQCYIEAEQKITKAGQLGNLHAYYNLACLYSLTNRLEESLSLLIKAYKLEILPDIDDVLEDAWLDNLKETEIFSNFIIMINNKQNIKE
jgi:tetratricopeptide (TPR) repeat protein